jgi:hypothetical protein
LSAELYAHFARRDLERRLASPATRFRNEWGALTAAARYTQRLERERGRLEISSQHQPGCCAWHVHA